MSKEPNGKSDWRAHLRSLTQKERDLMLERILEWQIDMLGVDADVRFRKATPEWGETAAFYWNSCGNILTEKQE